MRATVGLQGLWLVKKLSFKLISHHFANHARLATINRYVGLKKYDHLDDFVPKIGNFEENLKL
jgi:hypothetical protein